MTDADTDQTKVEETKEEIKEDPKKAEQAEQAEKGEPAERKEKQEKKTAEPAKKTKEEKKVKEKKAVKVSPKLKKVIEEIENLSVIELADLVNALQDRFGVTAAAPAMAAAAPTAGSAPAGEGQTSEQTTFNVILAESGANKISVIKVVKGLVPDLGLKEAKDLVESTPKEVLTGVNKEKAEEAKQKLEDAGAKVEFK